MARPEFAQLFGPVQDAGSWLGNPIAGQWSWIGSATTASTKTFEFQLGFPSLSLAMWRVIWRTNSVYQYAGLFHMDNGPSNITQIAQMTGDGTGNPANQALDVTTALNTLITNQTYKNIGFRVWGDSTPSAMRIYEVRLELTWST